MSVRVRIARVVVLGGLLGLVAAVLPVIASAEACPKNEAFRTGPSANLPDCRAYELVTPADKGATQDLFAPGVRTFALPAPGGDSIALEAFAALEPGPSSGLTHGYMLSRTASGWAMASLTPSGGQASFPKPFSWIFSPDLSQVGLALWTEKTAFLAPSEQSFEVGPPGGPYPTIATTPWEPGAFDELQGASSDFSRVVLASADHTLLSPTPTGTDTAIRDLYEFVNGQGPRLVNVTSSGLAIGTCGATLGDGQWEERTFHTSLAHHAVSADGSKIIFMAPDPVQQASGAEGCSLKEGDEFPTEGPNPERLYVRVSETVGGHEESKTLDVSEPQGVTLEGVEEEEGVVYQDASVDGSKVFFTTYMALTPDATRGSAYRAVGHLYEYDTKALAGERLKLIFQSEELAVRDNTDGTVYVSEDGSVAYFYTNGTQVLYRYEAAGGGSVHVIVGGMGAPADNGEAPYITPNGEFFLFTAQNVSGEPRGAGHNELYLYDHAAGGSVTCVSCGPGVAPAGGNEYESSRFGTILETPDRTPEMIPMSDDGRYVFFNSTAALTPKAVSGETSVYEWEAGGAGACTQSVGCTYLISQGNSPGNSILLGASSDGANVFLATHAQLVAQDIDAYGDIYDARIGGGLPPPPAGSGACQGDACTSPPAWPNDSTPAWSSVSGPGNPAPLLTAPKPKAKRCVKGKVLKKGRCVKRRPVKRKAKRATRRAVKHNRGGSK
jgi:hypothetical protein